MEPKIFWYVVLEVILIEIHRFVFEQICVENGQQGGSQLTENRQTCQKALEFDQLHGPLLRDRSIL